MEKLKDLEFLKDLQKRIKEQEDDCQAYPRFWTIMHTVKKHGLSDDNEPVLYTDGGESCYYTEEELKELFDSLICDSEFEDQEEFLKEKELELSEIPFDDFSDFSYFINEHFDYGSDIGYYREEEEVIPGLLFLTKEECKEHIRKNHYHYGKNPHTYAMTVWRNPDLEKVMDILNNFDFYSLLKEDKN